MAAHTVTDRGWYLLAGLAVPPARFGRQAGDCEVDLIDEHVGEVSRANVAVAAEGGGQVLADEAAATGELVAEFGE